jgi:hypothetical protein
MTTDEIRRGIVAALVDDGVSRSAAEHHAKAVLAWMARAGLSIVGPSSDGTAAPRADNDAEARATAETESGRYLRPRR